MANAQIVFEGDSRSADTEWIYTVYDYIEPRFGLTLGFACFAEPGDNFADLNARAATLDATIIADVANVLVVWVGVNDRYSKTATQLHDSLLSYCSSRQTAGWYVVVCTEIAGDESYMAGWDAKYKEFNTLIRANYTTYADRLIDFGANIIFSDWDTYNNQYYNDYIHPNTAGNRVLASIAIPEIVGGTPALVSLTLELEALGLLIDGTE